MAIQSAFQQLMAYENSLGYKQSQQWANYFEGIAPLFDGRSTLHELLDEPPLPMSWVAEVLYRPLYFAGLGLSESESGLWWLLVQRARLLAKLDRNRRPRAFILLNRQQDKDRHAFWRSEPCGIEPLWCDDWDAGWRDLEEHAHHTVVDF